MKKIFTILLFIFFTLNAFAQSKKETSLWKLYSFSGVAKIIGDYQIQDRKGKDINEIQKSGLLSPSILLRTKNYIWHRRFLCIDIDGEYSPTKSSNKYLVIPDQSETRTMKKIDARLSMLPQFKISLAAYFNYGQVYSIRENLYNINSSGKSWGSTVFIKTKKLPVSIVYSGRTDDENEIQTGRRFLSNQNNLEAITNTSFGKWDKQNLSISHNEFFRRDFSRFEVSNKINNLNYNNFFSFGVKKRNNSNMLITGVWQNGYETFRRYQLMENINYELHKQLHAGINYNYFSDQRNLHSLYQHRIGSHLQHQLFESLNTQISYDHDFSKNTAFSQSINNGSINIVYTKKIMQIHNLDFSYRNSIQTQKWNSKDEILTILNESVNLKDGEITLLLRPNVTIASIVVKNTTGNIIYQLNSDYIITPQNNFIQIQRVSGGLIPDNTTVYVDYSAMQPGNYHFTGKNYQFTSGVSFFKRKLSFYYRRSVQTYSNLEKTDFLTLNYFTQNLFGFKADFKFMGGGIELDNNMKNNILPYKLFRYYLNIQKSLMNNLVVFANGNLYDYKKLNTESNIKYFDVSGSATYRFSKKLLFQTSVSYRKQNGEKIDLNLLNYRAQLDLIVLQLKMTLAYNFYNRKMFEEQIRSNAFNIQLSRRF